jgi:hypothetical protein
LANRLARAEEEKKITEAEMKRHIDNLDSGISDIDGFYFMSLM